MEFKDNLFESIVIEGKSTEDNDIFDDIANAEAKLDEYGDLYDAFDKIKKTLDGPSKYNEIQTVAPAIDVNTGVVLVKGVTKHAVKADAQESGGAESKEMYSDSVIKAYADDLKSIIPSSLKLELNILDDVADKIPFEILISRKG